VAAVERFAERRTVVLVYEVVMFALAAVLVLSLEHDTRAAAHAPL
jgi:hypothetical protein